MRIDLFSDLDNTLIYSHRTVLEQDKVLAETLNGKEQSYMTRKTLEFLQNAPWIRLIPVTTRSKEQFQRITLFSRELSCPYALVCNGGELLICGETDPQWLEETRSILAQELRALASAIALMERMAERVRVPSGLMAYAVFDDPKEAARQLRGEIDGTLLHVLYDRRKVYCFPGAMNKGAAVGRFKKRFPTGPVVAAGDSEFDIPMLNMSDLAITKRSLAKSVKNPNTVPIDDALLLSDGLTGVLERLSQRDFS